MVAQDGAGVGVGVDVGVGVGEAAMLALAPQAPSAIATQTTIAAVTWRPE
jgi:hypothetical protein